MFLSFGVRGFALLPQASSKAGLGLAITLGLGSEGFRRQKIPHSTFGSSSFAEKVPGAFDLNLLKASPPPPPLYCGSQGPPRPGSPTKRESQRTPEDAETEPGGGDLRGVGVLDFRAFGGADTSLQSCSRLRCLAGSS